MFSARKNNNSLPLCVDLDGTLVKTDTLIESILILIKKNPGYLISLLWWLQKGKAHLKQQIAQRVKLPIKNLPYHKNFLNYLKQEHQRGRKLILATAAHHNIATAVADHLHIFSEVIASDKNKNVSGITKANILAEKFGQYNFVYAGNSIADLPVWEKAHAGVIVTSSKHVLSQAVTVTNVIKRFSSKRISLQILLRALRYHQWVKNILLFTPLIAAHLITDINFVFASIIAFISFSLITSGVYVLNDLLDLSSDRRHFTKKNRPFAAGDLSLTIGLILALTLFIFGFGLARFLPFNFTSWLFIYITLNLFYSLFLRQEILIDVMLLAFLYTLRIFAGASAINISVSIWLMVFSFFLFLGLALLKRFSGLQPAPNESYGRGYLAQDSQPISQLGIASGFTAALVLSLYIKSPVVSELYSQAIILWIEVPLLILWVSRLWLLAHRGRIKEDPLVFTMHDTVSYMLLAAMLTVVILAV
jgi:4-hydroxybenzoate polyprenyltransferase/phosphoglycolate phosphatase-like HAD superfamily hydrolase